MGEHPWLHLGTLPKGDQNLGIKTLPFTDFLIHYNNLKHKNQCIAILLMFFFFSIFFLFFFLFF